MSILGSEQVIQQAHEADTFSPEPVAVSGDLLSVAEVARLNNQSRQAVWRSVRRGRIPVTLVGGKVRIKTSDARAYGRSRKVKPGRPPGPTSTSGKRRVSTSKPKRPRVPVSESSVPMLLE